MTSAPDDTRKGHIDTLIAGLKSDGVWTLLDRLYVCAAHDEQAARVDWITAANVLTAVNSPTFTTDRGFTGDGATSYLNTGFNPLSGTPKYTQNDATMGVWCGTDVSAFNQYDIGHSTRAMICARNSTNILCYINNGATNGPLGGANTSVGNSMWTRRSSTVVEVYKNGASLAETTATSSAPYNLNFLLCAGMGSGGTPSGYSTRRVQAGYWGSQMSDAQASAMHNRLATYMTAVGD